MTSFLIFSSILILLSLSLIAYIKKFKQVLLHPYSQFFISLYIFFLYSYVAITVFHDTVFITALLTINAFFLIFRKKIFLSSLISVFTIILAFFALSENYLLVLTILYAASIPILINRNREFLIAIALPIIISFLKLNSEHNYYYLLLFIITVSILFILFSRKEEKEVNKNIGYSDIIVIAICTALCISADTELDYSIAAIALLLLKEHSKQLRLYAFLFLALYFVQVQNMDISFHYLTAFLLTFSFIFLEKKRISPEKIEDEFILIDFSKPSENIHIDKSLLLGSDLKLLMTFYDELETDNHFKFKFQTNTTDTVCILNVSSLTEIESLDFIGRVYSFLPKYAKPVLLCNKAQIATITFFSDMERIESVSAYIRELQNSSEYEYLFYIENDIELYEDFFDRFLDHFIDENIDVLFPLLTFSRTFQHPSLYNPSDKQLTIEELYQEKRQEKVEIESAETNIFMINLNNIKLAHKEQNLYKLLFKNELKTYLALDLCFVNKRKSYRFDQEITGNAYSFNNQVSHKNIAIICSNIKDLYSFPIDILYELSKDYNFYLVNPNEISFSYDLFIKFSENKIEYAKDHYQGKLVFHELLSLPKLILPKQNIYENSEFKLELFIVNPEEIKVPDEINSLKGPVFPEQYSLIYKHTRVILHNSKTFDFELYNALKYSHIVMSYHPLLSTENFQLDNLNLYSRESFQENISNVSEEFRIELIQDQIREVLKSYFEFDEIVYHNNTALFNLQNINNQKQIDIDTFCKENSIRLIHKPDLAYNFYKYSIFLSIDSLDDFISVNRFKLFKDEENILTQIKVLIKKNAFDKIIKFFIKHPFIYQMPNVLNELGAAYFQLQDFENARKFFMFASEQNNIDAKANLQDLENYLKNEYQREEQNLKSDSTDFISH
jgi:hypothetical protein